MNIEEKIVRNYTVEFTEQQFRDLRSILVNTIAYGLECAGASAEAAGRLEKVANEMGAVLSEALQR